MSGQGNTASDAQAIREGIDSIQGTGKYAHDALDALLAAHGAAEARAEQAEAELERALAAFNASCAETDRFEARAEQLRQALELVGAQQQATLEKLRRHGIVFERGDIGNDPKNWAHVAFSIYNDLCKVDLIASHALAADRQDGDA